MNERATADRENTKENDGQNHQIKLFDFLTKFLANVFGSFWRPLN